MCLFLWVIPVCVACIFLLSLCMNLCFCIMYFSDLIYIYIKFHKIFCVHILLFIYSSKMLCGIAQLDVGDVTIWYHSMKVFRWHDLAWVVGYVTLQVQWNCRPNIFLENMFSSLGFTDFGSLIMDTFIIDLIFVMT
jgi:hypothetical protein